MTHEQTALLKRMSPQQLLDLSNMAALFFSAPESRTVAECCLAELKSRAKA